MSLASEYSRQLGWRPWAEVMDRLPPLAGKVVLDLGCGIGDQAAQLAERGACVLGLDTNQELLAAAQTRNIPNTEFRSGDLTTLEDRLGVFDGIWCMKLLKAFCGPMFDSVRDDFLTALSRSDHRSSAKVYSCIATL